MFTWISLRLYWEIPLLDFQAMPVQLEPTYYKSPLTSAPSHWFPLAMQGESSSHESASKLLTSIPAAPQCPASSGLLPPLHGQLHGPAGPGGGPRSDRLLLRSPGPGSQAGGFSPVLCLPDPPGTARLCVQAAGPPRAPSARDHTADVPGLHRHGESCFWPHPCCLNVLLFSKCPLLHILMNCNIIFFIT